MTSFDRLKRALFELLAPDRAVLALLLALVAMVALIEATT